MGRQGKRLWWFWEGRIHWLPSGATRTLSLGLKCPYMVNEVAGLDKWVSHTL